MADIVERLRICAKNDPHDTKDNIFADAADEIERLRQQVDLLLGALNQMVRHHDQLTPEDIKQAKDAIAKATGGD